MPIDKKKGKSKIQDALEHKGKPDNSGRGNFKVSFADYDSSQKYGSTFLDWQNAGLLSRCFEVLQGYCSRPLEEQLDDKFTVYGDFPPANITKFEKPKHVTQDARWARIKINGPACLIGHVIDGTFYLVFLDKTHKFWPTAFARPKKDGGRA